MGGFRVLLRVHEVARTFGDQRVFDGVSLEVGAGDHVALIGENGSGKSTLLRLMAGLDAPGAGTVTRQGSVALLTQHAEGGEGTVLDGVTPPEVREAGEAFGRRRGGASGLF